MKPFWVRFYTSKPQHFEYHGPWWESGQTMSDPPTFIICCAVMAENERRAQRIIGEAFDKGHAPDEWSFVHEKPVDWSPFGDRFRRAEWMQWPHPTSGKETGR